MDTTNTTTNSASAARDRAQHRRAYLDTYARRRTGKSDVEPEVVIESVVSALDPAPVTQQPQIEVQQVPIVVPVITQANEPVVIESQPPVVGDTFSYTIPQPEAAQAQPKKSYLDTLTQRHTAAVVAAPQAEETVMQSALGYETESLFEEPTYTDNSFVDEEKIEANLGALYGDYSLTNQLANSTNSASASHVRTIVASSLACGILALGITGLLGRYSSQPVVAQPTDAPVIEVDASSVKPPTGSGATNSLSDFPQTDPTHPVRMLISSIGVNAPVQSLGATKDGLIDVPQSYGVVGWYNKASVPGKPGPAVLVGHYTGGNGGVFDKLKDLKDGDLITVTNGKGQTFTYKVSAKNEYAKDAVPMAELFKSSNESKLQIITCSGKWQSKNYNNRLVITAEIVK